jgi:type VI protein secretion system component Hcp
MDGAEVTCYDPQVGLPILGEAMAPPFNQQVEVLDWNWKIVNQEEVEWRAKDAPPNSRPSDKEVSSSSTYLPRTSRTMRPTRSEGSRQGRNQKNRNRSGALKEIDPETRNVADKARGENTKAKGEAQQRKEDYEEEKKQKELGNLEFSFSKRVDFASTQMLNCMKAGEILPRVVITILGES